MRTGAGLRATALFVSMLASTATAASPEIETRVDSAQVRSGESVTLSLRVRGPLIASEPDLSPLESAFEVLDVGRSQRRSVINGVYDSSSDWTITLLPKRAGTLEIPALRVGSAFSEPQSITVVSANDATVAPSDEAPAAPTPVLVRVLAEREDPYEQERTLLRVRLYAGPEIIEGALSELEIEGAAVERLGEDRSFNEQVSGRPYRGIERTYAVLPEAPGKLTVPPVSFEGLVRDKRPASSRRRFGGFGASLFDELFSNRGFGEDFFDSFLDRGTRRVVVRSEPLTLDVRPRPQASGSAWWLPAREVSLTESWDPTPGEVRVGEALSRRITLRADGAGISQLPALAPPELEGVKQYAEAPQSREGEAGSVRIQEFTVIPTQPGRLELPPIEVAWWDTVADAPRVASLDPRAIEVLPGAAGEAPATPRNVVSSPVAVAPDPGRPAASSWRSPWLAWASGLLGLSAIAAATWRLLRRGAVRPRDRGPNLRSAERSLRRACRRSDPAAAEGALHQVIRSYRPRTPGIQGEQWARELGSHDLAREVARLQSVRYSTTAEEWKGGALWTAYRATRGRRRDSRRKPRGGLPPLYPAIGSER